MSGGGPAVPEACCVRATRDQHNVNTTTVPAMKEKVRTDRMHPPAFRSIRLFAPQRTDHLRFFLNVGTTSENCSFFSTESTRSKRTRIFSPMEDSRRLRSPMILRTFS